MSGGFILIDRRKNPKAKSLSNRQRFVDRAKKAVRESAKKALSTRSMSDQTDVDVSISTDGLEEPRFGHDQTVGEYDYVLPGNHDFIVGDIIRKPPQQDGGGGGGSGSGDGGGGGEDEFEFSLAYDEFLDVIFDDLELPDLIKQSEKNAVSFVNRRAGHTNVGIPANLNVEKTAVAGIARRIALKAPKLRKIKELEEEIESILAKYAPEEVLQRDDIRRIAELENEIKSLRAKSNAISYLDNVDLRYNNFVKQPRPVTQAVMFCVMDVSFSMGEREKIIAKKFFLLLNLFLRRRYKNIEVVFVRHHDSAIECDEETFFTSREGGGTVVSSGYEEVKKIIADRYDPADWNIYIAQASDGDNEYDDNARVQQILTEDFLPVVQHFVYIEIDRGYYGFYGKQFAADSGLWKVIAPLANVHENISVAQIDNESEVIRVFRNMFKQDRNKA